MGASITRNCHRDATTTPARSPRLLIQSAISVLQLRGHVHDLHRYLHALEGIRIPRPAAGQRTGLVLLTGHGDGNMLAAGKLVVGRIEAVPARAGDVDFGPGMRGPVLALAHLDVAGDEARAEAPVARSLHHQHREVAARSAAERQRVMRELNPRLLAMSVFE